MHAELQCNSVVDECNVCAGTGRVAPSVRGALESECLVCDGAGVRVCRETLLFDTPGDELTPESDVECPKCGAAAEWSRVTEALSRAAERESKE